MWRKLRLWQRPVPAAESHPPRKPYSPEDLLRRMDWRVLRPVAAQLGGNERSLMRGFGLELNELREYQVGDDIRRIDWNTTARSNQPFVRDAYVERALDVWLVLDLSASVDWGTAECLKRERTLEFAAVTGQLLGRHGNRVGALLFADRPCSFIPPARGRLHLLRLLDGIQHEPHQSRHGQTDLRAALVRAATMIKRRSLVIVVSDFLAPDGWQSTLGELAQRHEVLAVHTSDPREIALTDVGLITLEDPETGAQLLVDTSDHVLRQRFQEAAREQAERIRADLAVQGVDLLRLSTAESVLPALIHFLSVRRSARTPRVRPAMLTASDPSSAVS